jgi:hypothetical protein
MTILPADLRQTYDLSVGSRSQAADNDPTIPYIPTFGT